VRRAILLMPQLHSLNFRRGTEYWVAAQGKIGRTTVARACGRNLRVRNNVVGCNTTALCIFSHLQRVLVSKFSNIPSVATGGERQWPESPLQVSPVEILTTLSCLGTRSLRFQSLLFSFVHYRPFVSDDHIELAVERLLRLPLIGLHAL